MMKFSRWYKTSIENLYKRLTHRYILINFSLMFWVNFLLIVLCYLLQPIISLIVSILSLLIWDRFELMSNNISKYSEHIIKVEGLMYAFISMYLQPDELISRKNINDSIKKPHIVNKFKNHYLMEDFKNFSKQTNIRKFSLIDEFYKDIFNMDLNLKQFINDLKLEDEFNHLKETKRLNALKNLAGFDLLVGTGKFIK